jgi:hypothetical protein
VDELAIMVMAPEGYSPSGASFPAINDRLSQGAVLAAVIARESRPRVTPSARRTARASSRRGGRTVGGLVGVAVVVAGAVIVLSRSSGTEPARAMARREHATPPAPPAVTQDSPADSLYYSVQVAAHNTLAQAMLHAADIERKGHLAIVSPTRTGNQGVWYRVLVGALPTARAADSLLQTLWQEGALERPQGTILRTPDAYRLRASRDDLPGLRARGIPAYIVLSPDKTDLVYVGAFDLAEQATSTDSLLGSAHLTGTLVRRTGSSQ